jgi:nucleoside-diphosphate-sugar epimerase
MTDLASPKKVLITGAYGLIGSLVCARLAAQPDRYDVYGLDRVSQRSARSQHIPPCELPAGHLSLADLSDLAAVRAAAEGMEVVVHLAADASGGDGWESVLANNIIGTHNVFEACRLARVRRVIFASSNQVVFGYRPGGQDLKQTAIQREAGEPQAFRPIDHTWPARPLNDYACSKVYGEALAHMYAHTHGLSCLCLRIGWVTPDGRVPKPAGRELWCSQRDIVQIIERCVNAPASLRFDVFFGQSDNRDNLVDIQHARDVLGYAPQDRAEDHLD